MEAEYVGHEPSSSDPIPFARPSIGDDEIAAVTRVLRSGWLTTGTEATAFEQEFAAAIGVRHCLAVNSATAGLHLALEAAGVTAGDRVIVPSLTFTASAEVVRYLGAEVVFADVTPDSLLVDPLAIEAAAARTISAGHRVAAIMPVHLTGAVCDLDAIHGIARDIGCAVIEDAAHAFPAWDDHGHAGTRSDAGVFSFYANKTITTGEGGMVATNRDDLAERVRIMRLHGIDRTAWDRFRTVTVGSNAPEYEIVAAGYKYNMPDTAAAIGRVQLSRARTFLERRETIVRWYSEGLSECATTGEIILPAPSNGHAWHLYVARFPTPGVRDRVRTALANAGIGTSIHYRPLHEMPYWRERYPDQGTYLSHTATRGREILSLPLYPDLTKAEVIRVVDTIVGVVKEQRGG